MSSPKRRGYATLDLHHPNAESAKAQLVTFIQTRGRRAFSLEKLIRQIIASPHATVLMECIFEESVRSRLTLLQYGTLIDTIIGFGRDQYGPGKLNAERISRLLMADSDFAMIEIGRYYHDVIGSKTHPLYVYLYPDAYWAWSVDSAIRERAWAEAWKRLCQAAIGFPTLTPPTPEILSQTPSLRIRRQQGMCVPELPILSSLPPNRHPDDFHHPARNQALGEILKRLFEAMKREGLVAGGLSAPEPALDTPDHLLYARVGGTQMVWNGNFTRKIPKVTDGGAMAWCLSNYFNPPPPPPPPEPRNRSHRTAEQSRHRSWQGTGRSRYHRW